MKEEIKYFTSEIVEGGYYPTVLAKFKCETLTIDEHNTICQMKAVTDGSEENKSFSKFTPCANLSMTISKDTEANGFFEPGKEYYLTFQGVI